MTIFAERVLRTTVKRKCLEMILGFESELMLDAGAMCKCVVSRKKSHKIHKMGWGESEETSHPDSELQEKILCQNVGIEKT